MVYRLTAEGFKDRNSSLCYSVLGNQDYRGRTLQLMLLGQGWCVYKNILGSTIFFYLLVLLSRSILWGKKKLYQDVWAMCFLASWLLYKIYLLDTGRRHQCPVIRLLAYYTRATKSGWCSCLTLSEVSSVLLLSQMRICFFSPSLWPYNRDE